MEETQKHIILQAKRFIEAKGVGAIIREIAPDAEFTSKEIRLGDRHGAKGTSLAADPVLGQWFDHNTKEKGDFIALCQSLLAAENRPSAARALLRRFGVEIQDKAEKPVLIPVTPVPKDAPDNPYKVGKNHPTRAGFVVVALYLIKTADGLLHHLRVRFEGPEKPNGKRSKMVLPLSYCGEDGWRFIEPKEGLLPLYNLGELSLRPDATVLVVEGEKTAEAAKGQFPEHVVITWVGGSSSPHKSDWSTLSGRRVICCPDADEAGLKTVEPLTDLLRKVGVEEFRLIELPDDLPKGWDLADEAPKELDMAALFESATPIDLAAMPAFLRLSFEELIERIYYVVAEDAFIDCVTMLKMPPKQFGYAFAHLQTPGSDGLVRYLLKERPDRKVDAIGYRPGDTKQTYQDAEGIRFLNSWKPSSIVSTDGDASTFTSHLGYQTNTEEEFEFLADALAFMVQNPGMKLMFALLIIGQHGTGKSYIAEVMRTLLGTHNATVVSTNELKSAFDEYMLNKVLVVIEEVMALGRREITNTLKPLITQPRITLNVKNARRLEVDNHANFILTSNHHDPLPIEKNERRLWVLLSRAVPKEQSYYDHLWSWTALNYGVILNWLLKRKIPKNFHNARPPMTDGRKTMIAASRSELEIDMEDRIKDRDDPFRFDLIELRVVERFYREHFGRQMIGVRQTLHTLGAQDLLQHKIVENGQKTQRSLWCVRNHEKWLGMARADRLRAFLAFQSGPKVTDGSEQDQIPF